MANDAKIILAAAVVLGLALPAHADCALVSVPVPDRADVLALRAGPGTQYPMLLKLHADELLFIAPRVSGQWVFVQGAPRIDGPNPELDAHGNAKITRGWVNGHFLKTIPCPYAGGSED
jgi:hypothetical protein